MKRKLEVESTDYAQREYGVTPEDISALQKTVDNRYRRLQRSGKLTTVSVGQLRGMLTALRSTPAPAAPLRPS